jgi:hypothetical protein
MNLEQAILWMDTQNSILLPSMLMPVRDNC